MLRAVFVGVADVDRVVRCAACGVRRVHDQAASEVSADPHSWIQVGLARGRFDAAKFDSVKSCACAVRRTRARRSA